LSNSHQIGALSIRKLAAATILHHRKMEGHHQWLL